MRWPGASAQKHYQFDGLFKDSISLLMRGVNCAREQQEHQMKIHSIRYF